MASQVANRFVGGSAKTIYNSYKGIGILDRGRVIYHGGCFGLLNKSNDRNRMYMHFAKIVPEDVELPLDTMPKDVNKMMKKNPKHMDFFENYWYWRLRGEASVLDAENLPKKSYKQLAVDMGLQVATPEAEHMCGVLELYEYLKSSPFVGPFGTVENPVLVPSINDERMVGCTGGTGDNEHVPLWFRCREGFLYRCGECDQVFMLVRALYSLPEGVDPFPKDPDVKDVFDLAMVEKLHRKWNCGEFVNWPAGDVAFKDIFIHTVKNK